MGFLCVCVCMHLYLDVREALILAGFSLPQTGQDSPLYLLESQDVLETALRQLLLCYGIQCNIARFQSCNQSVQPFKEISINDYMLRNCSKVSVIKSKLA